MEEVYLPLDIIMNSPGFSIDIGCSTAKLIYRPKSLYKNGEIISQEKIKDNNLGPLYLQLFKRGDIEGLGKVIREECDVSAQPGQEVSVVGYGCSARKQHIEEVLNINLKVEMEFDITPDAMFFLLEHISPEQIFMPEPPGVREEALNTFRLFQPWVEGSKGLSRVKWEMGQDEEEALSWRPDPSADIYPYLLLGCGSIVVILKVSQDGSIDNLGPIYFSGRFVAGLSATLTGEKDFNKLIKMAEESDGRTTDLYASELANLDKEPDSEGSMNENEKTPDAYSTVGGDINIFPFGKPATFDNEVKKGDMVHSVLETACLNMASMAQSKALANGCKHVFFAGNFVKPPLIHKWLSRELIRRNMESPVEKRVDFRFIRHGGHLANIGAFIQGSKREINKRTAKLNE